MNIDISVHDLLDSMDTWDIEIIVKYLQDEGYIETIKPDQGIIQEEFFENLDKLKKNYFSITKEEIEIIEKISKRF